MHLSIIVPCRNEERRLPGTLRSVARYLDDSQLDAEVIVVDNGSRDRTREAALALAPLFRSLRVIEENQAGKGWAVRQGMLAARGDWRLFTDADGSTSIEHLPLMFESAETGAAVVVSSRRAPGAKVPVKQPWHRRVLGDVFAAAVRAVVPVGVRDTQNGFKLFRADAAAAIFSRLSTFRWAFDVEVLAIARALGYEIGEVPVTWVNDEGSQMTLAGMAGMAADVGRIWLRRHRHQMRERPRPAHAR